jgi:hypothetical protein
MPKGVSSESLVARRKSLAAQKSCAAVCGEPTTGSQTGEKEANSQLSRGLRHWFAFVQRTFDWSYKTAPLCYQEEIGIIFSVTRQTTSICSTKPRLLIPRVSRLRQQQGSIHCCAV